MRINSSIYVKIPAAVLVILAIFACRNVKDCVIYGDEEFRNRGAIQLQSELSEATANSRRMTERETELYEQYTNPQWGDSCNLSDRELYEDMKNWRVFYDLKNREPYVNSAR